MQLQISEIVENSLIGVYAHERDKKQEVIVNLSVDLYEFDWINQDILSSTVDYDELADLVRDMVANSKFFLLEGLAQHIATVLLQKYELIKKVNIRLTKVSQIGVKAGSISINYEMERKFRVALALGSNHTSLPKAQLITAIELLEEYVFDLQIGGFYETKPFGFLEQNNFYNTAIIGYTYLSLPLLFTQIKKIEKLMGKNEVQINGPRIIDIDLIFYDINNCTNDVVPHTSVPHTSVFHNVVSHTSVFHNFVSVPHPACHLRDFVLKPLMDIEPDLLHPVLNKTISQLYTDLPSELKTIHAKVSASKA